MSRTEMNSEISNRDIIVELIAEIVSIFYKKKKHKNK